MSHHCPQTHSACDIGWLGGCMEEVASRQWEGEVRRQINILFSISFQELGPRGVLCHRSIFWAVVQAQLTACGVKLVCSSLPSPAPTPASLTSSPCSLPPPWTLQMQTLKFPFVQAPLAPTAAQPRGRFQVGAMGTTLCWGW